jgi:hypothetical protein
MSGDEAGNNVTEGDGIGVMSLAPMSSSRCRRRCVGLGVGREGLEHDVG